VKGGNKAKKRSPIQSSNKRPQPRSNVKAKTAASIKRGMSDDGRPNRSTTNCKSQQNIIDATYYKHVYRLYKSTGAKFNNQAGLHEGENPIDQTRRRPRIASPPIPISSGDVRHRSIIKHKSQQINLVATFVRKITSKRSQSGWGAWFDNQVICDWPGSAFGALPT
jgi:hypothetical protein